MCGVGFSDVGFRARCRKLGFRGFAFRDSGMKFVFHACCRPRARVSLFRIFGFCFMARKFEGQ